MKRYLSIYCILLIIGISSSYAQEKVYVSTDRNSYIAGEDLWCSVYCIEESSGEYSHKSSVAYLEFHSLKGLEDIMKVALIEGRGCGRFQIPFSFATGNYTIVAYTRVDGGNSTEPFKGKTVSIFNTITGEKIEGGTKVTEAIGNGEANGEGNRSAVRFKIEVDKNDEEIKVSIKNLYDSRMYADMNVSMFHWDEVEKSVEKQGTCSGLLTGRWGSFSPTGITEYAGEVIKVRVSSQNGNNSGNLSEKYLYMGAKGNEDDLYVGVPDSLGYVTYYTNNMSGDKELLFEVVDDVLMTTRTTYAEDNPKYTVKIVGEKYNHTPDRIPLLQISPDIKDALEQRNIRMQISKRFEADSLFNLMEMRSASYLGAAGHTVYNLDDYTRFPTMEDVIREYVKYLRIRKMNGVTSLRVVNDDQKEFVWVAKSPALALLDGVPIRNHEILVNMNPLLVKQIIVYPRQFILNHIVFDGVVKFNTYKGDMGGVKLEDIFQIIPHKGVQYPLAMLGDGIKGNVAYPNYNGTLYWNPIICLGHGENFEFTVARPKYSGQFKIRIEGIDAVGKSIFHEEIVTL